MAIAYVTGSAIGQTGFPTSPRTFSSVACGSDANTCVIGWVVTNSGDANSITNMSVGGDTSGTTASTEASWGGNDNLRLFRWLGSNPGTCDIAFTHTGDASIIERGYVVYSGVSAVANITEAINASGTTTPSATVTSATGDLAVMVLVHDNTTPTVTGQGGSLRLDIAGAFARHVVCDEPGAASVTVDATTSATVYAIARWGFSLTAATGGGGGSSIAAISHYYRMMSQ